MALPCTLQTTYHKLVLVHLLTGGTNSLLTWVCLLLVMHSAVATAEQINKTETYRDPDSFADIVRGMHLYGRKILRPEALVNAVYNLA